MRCALYVVSVCVRACVRVECVVLFGAAPRGKGLPARARPDVACGVWRVAVAAAARLQLLAHANVHFML